MRISLCRKTAPPSFGHIKDFIPEKDFLPGCTNQMFNKSILKVFFAIGVAFGMGVIVGTVI